VDRSFDPSPKECSDVRWSQAALRAYPSIAEACQAVEQRNGKSYVKFEGVVESVKDQGNRIRVDFEDGEELTFIPPPQTVLYLDGERTSFADVRDGMQLNFYVPEDRLQAELRPDPSRVAFIIFPLDISATAIPQRQQSMAQEQSDRADRNQDPRSAMNRLPDTASPWPLIGAGGAALLVLGAAMTRRRRNRHR
jgi:LPXTG-motif cell wall-anchored protein